MRVTKPEHRSHCGSLQRMPANVSVTRKADRRNTLCRPLLTQAVPVGTPTDRTQTPNVIFAVTTVSAAFLTPSTTNTPAEISRL